MTAGGYFWIVFTSIREYGNVYQGASVQKQIWVAAITPGSKTGVDPSHPPFYLPNQSDTRNERGFWALEPCKAVGKSCDTGDECCDGFCRPSDPNDPMSPKVCKPPGGGCSQNSEKCTKTSDCCGAAGGTTCIGGFCTPVRSSLSRGGARLDRLAIFRAAQPTIAASTSAMVFGAARERTSGSPLVISTSSSMRMPRTSAKRARA